MKTTLSVLLGAFSLLSGANAQIAYTDPVGYVTSVAGATSGPTLSLVSPALVEKIDLTAVPTAAAVGSGSLTFAGGVPSVTAGSHYIENSDTGWWADIQSATATVVTLPAGVTVPTGTAATSKFNIRKHVTLTSYFGNDNKMGLVTGTSADAADVVQFWNSTTQSLGSQYFYAGAAEGVTPGWYDENGGRLGGDVADPVIAPGEGLVVTRRFAGEKKLVHVGHVKLTPTAIDLTPGINIVSALRAVGPGLGDVNLDTGAIATGLKRGTEPGDSDTVQVAVGGTQYFAGPATSADTTGFFDENGAPSGASPLLTEGQAVIITRRASSGNGVWTSKKQPVSTTP